MGAGVSKLGKESLYDLLGVDPDVERGELKQAYRRKALELHPDRNFQQEEQVTALFAKVQAAYDLLSNVEERHWYDQHRLSASASYDSYDENATPAAVVRQVTDELVRASDSSGKLDYGLIQGYFDKLKHEEQEAAFEQNLDVPAVALAAQFGQSRDPWAKVKDFYNTWQDFSTIKTFSWEDIYPAIPASSNNKQTRKKFEQENRKVREAAKLEFNAAVRRAVLLLKQRDPRKPPQKAVSSGSAPSKGAKSAQATNLLESTQSDGSPGEKLASLSLENKPEKKMGKAKAKAQRKKQGHNHILTCGTCGLELSGPDLMEHKRITRHP